MKIIKTPWRTEIEFNTKELSELAYTTPENMLIGIVRWIKKNFGLDLFSISSTITKEKK